MDYRKFRNEALPPEQFHMFVERTSEARMRGLHRRWTGNDNTGRWHHGTVRLSEDPLYLRLQWKSGTGSEVRFVGNFEIKVRKLLINGYLRDERDGTVCLKFHHARDDMIYLKRRIDWPGIPMGYFRRCTVTNG